MSKEPIYITRKELEKKLMAITGATPATIVAETEPKMNKTGNPYFGQVTKLTTANVFINFNYENSVNRARAKEGNEEKFEAHARKWGERVPGTPLVMHKGSFYLEVRFLSEDKTKSAYFHNGQIIGKSILEAWMPSKNNVAVAETQGLSEDAVIIMRDYKLDTIREIRFGGEIYIIKN